MEFISRAGFLQNFSSFKKKIIVCSALEGKFIINLKNSSRIGKTQNVAIEMKLESKLQETFFPLIFNLFIPYFA